MGAALERDVTDVTLPGDPHPLGALHPITQMRREMEDILLGLRLPHRRRPRGRDRVAQLHGAQHAGRPPGALAERHVLRRGPPRPDAAHADLAGAGARDAAAGAADLPGRRRARSTGATTSTPPTARCSTRWRASPWTRASRWPHLKGTLLRFFRELLGAEREILLQPHFFPFTEPVGGRAGVVHRQERAPGVARARRRRDGRPERARGRRHRLGALHGLRVRLRPRPHRDDPVRRPRPAPLLRERPALPGAVRADGCRSRGWRTHARRPACAPRGRRISARAPSVEEPRALSAAARWSRRSTTSGVPDADGNLSAFRVGRVLTAERHPNADRLRVCTVDVGGRPSPPDRLRRPQRRRGPDGGRGAAGGAPARGGRAPRRAKLRGVESRRDDPVRATELRAGRRRGRDHGCFPRARPRARRSPRCCPSPRRCSSSRSPPTGRTAWRSTASPARSHAVTGAAAGAARRVGAAGQGRAAGWRTTRASRSRPPDLCPRYMARVLTDVQRRSLAGLAAPRAWRPPGCARSPTSWTSPTT